jgi:hypothetical protein
MIDREPTVVAVAAKAPDQDRAMRALELAMAAAALITAVVLAVLH